MRISFTPVVQLRPKNPDKKNLRGINIKSYSRTDNVHVGQYEINSIVHPGVSLHNSRSGQEPMTLPAAESFDVGTRADCTLSN